MFNIIKSESLKYKRTIIIKMLILAPVAAGLLSVFLMGGMWAQALALNIWYVFFLPFLVGYISSKLISLENKHLVHGMFGIYEDKKLLWIGKNLYSAGLIIISNCFMALVAAALYVLSGNNGSGVASLLISMLVLGLTMSWEAPFVMFIGRKVNYIITTFICVMLNVVCAIAFSLNLWWIPFAIPARLMCSLLGIYPNGIMIEAGSKYLDAGLVLPGILITAALFVLILMITAKLYENDECC